VERLPTLMNTGFVAVKAAFMRVAIRTPKP
jgi:hypothetical protein